MMGIGMHGGYFSNNPLTLSSNTYVFEVVYCSQFCKLNKQFETISKHPLHNLYVGVSPDGSVFMLLFCSTDCDD
jgi:hypothetical protein